MKASLWLSLIFFWFQFLLSLDELIYFSFMQLELSQPSPERFLYDFLSGPKHTMTSLMKHREDISDEKLNHHQTTKTTKITILLMHSTSFALKTDIMINTTQTINQLQQNKRPKPKSCPFPTDSAFISSHIMYL